MRVVIDASVALKWVLGMDRVEPNRSEAAALLKSIGDGGHEAIQPIHWRAEVMAVVARYDAARIDPALVLLHDFPHEVHADGLPLYRRAANIASDLNQHLFDTLYHAVALETGATLVTADERYVDKAAKLGNIASLADFNI